MLKELLKDHQLYHSEFQQDYYITTKAGGTLYGQYKQALRELYKRTRGLRESYCDKEKLEVEIDEQAFIAGQDDHFKSRYAGIEHKRKTMQMEELDRVIADTEREFKRFYQQATFLKGKIGELTDEKRKQLDEEMWEFKIKEMATIDLVAQGRFSATTYEMINAFPIKRRLELLATIKEHDKLINWYEHKEEDYLEIKDKDMDIKKLISNGN